MRTYSIKLQRVSGFTLIELMVSLVIGLIVIAATGSLFVSNRKTYAATESMARVSENGRLAFELLSRDIRQAGGNPCGINNNGYETLPADERPVINNVSGAAGNWYLNAANAVRGFGATEAVAGLTTGSSAGNRVANSPALALSGANFGTVYSFTQPGASVTAANFQLTSPNSDFDDDDIAFACTFSKGWLFQVTNTQDDGSVVVHNTGNSLNIKKNLMVNGTEYSWDLNQPAFLTKVGGIVWYLGCNGRQACTDPAGRSLYRGNLGVAADGTASVVGNEVIEGVDTLNFQYLENAESDYTDVGGVGNFEGVRAVRVSTRIQSPDRVQITARRAEAINLARQFTFTASVRNRL